MNPPTIRYPLPTLLALILLGLIAWQGAGLASSGWERVTERWHRLVEGPPVPSSTEPQVIAGPIVRRVLLLEEATPATERPDGRLAEFIRFPGFFDVYDVWPLEGEPSHYRIGNRRPFGWVPESKVLPWSTRLVARSSDGRVRAQNQEDPTGLEPVAIGTSPLPILNWEGDLLQIMTWQAGEAWQEPKRPIWVESDDMKAKGILLSRDELLILLDQVLGLAASEAGESLRARALIGRLTRSRALDKSEIAAVRSALPAFAFDDPGDPRADRASRLAQLNASWEPVASWGGLEFMMVPIQDLP